MYVVFIFGKKCYRVALIIATLGWGWGLIEMELPEGSLKEFLRYFHFNFANTRKKAVNYGHASSGTQI